MSKKELYLKITKELSNAAYSASDQAALNEIHFRTLTLIENLYGKSDSRVNVLIKFKSEKYDGNHGSSFSTDGFKGVLKGLLDGIYGDIKNDLIYDLEKQTIGSVVADFITLAKTSAEEGNKDVAAVLGAAALEDSLKRYGILNGLEVDDEDMSDVINMLKAKGLLKGPQASVVTSYNKTRNKAFHAEFAKIEMPEVKSMIAFAEEFVLKNLS